MKTAVLSDIHSNIDALEAVVDDARNWGAGQWLCAGDIVGYGSEPNACIRLLKDLGAKGVAGNHDWGVLEKTSIENFNKAARKAINWTKAQISPESKTFLESLTLVLETEHITLAHANFADPSSWDYVFTLSQAQAQFGLFTGKIGVIGHSHVPFIFKLEDEHGWGDQIGGDKADIKEGCRYLVNAGSVGQPRDDDPRACYLRVDINNSAMNLARVPYDICAAKKRISDAGLPTYLAERLTSGR